VSAAADPFGGATVPLLEVFSTFQGEGPRVGERQIFVRLARCDLRCAFCDTPESYPTPSTARVQVGSGGEGDEHPRNPVALADLVRWVERLASPRGMHRAVSVTGGEPLLHPAAVRAVAGKARELGLRAHLETGGHRPKELAQVLDVLDDVSPDLKLASATGAPTPWDAHRETLRLLHAAGKCLCVKAVVGASTTEEEVARAAAFAWEHASSAPLILQPVTKRPSGPDAPSARRLFDFHRAACDLHGDVRAIPQAHLLLGVR
jgi:organic radical activating enzyme